MNPNIFREYDIRGLHETDLTTDLTTRIGRALGTELIRRGESSLCVGRDVRPSGMRLRQALVEGLLSTGISVLDLGVVPTPALYFGILHLKTGGGVQITGSHNPPEFNGFKMCHGLSAIYGEQIQSLRRLIETSNFEKGAGQYREEDIRSAYTSDILQRTAISRRLRVVIDAGNGCAGEIAPAIFRSLGCEVIPLFCEVDGTFPNHLPDPTVARYMRDLISKVKETGADIGIGYDGDADRIGVVDDKGRIVEGDRLLALFARDVLTRVPGAEIIFDVKCSQALPEDIVRHGGKPVMWKTGHSLIKAKMKETGAPLAGEMSGHIFFSEGFHGYDDAIYCSARLAGILAAGGQPMSVLADAVPRFVSTPEIRVPATDEQKFAVVSALAEHFKRDHEVIDIDGARVLFGDGWGLVRASNTQPVIVMRFEAKTENRLKEIADTILTELRRHPSVDLSDVSLDAT